MKKEKETQIDRQREKEIERQSESERNIICIMYKIYRNGKDKETIVARENKNGKK